MRPEPYRLPRSNDWCLDISPSDTEALTDCPGLRVTADKCYGAIDAITAACFRLKREEPKKQEYGLALPEQFNNLRDYQKGGVVGLHNIQSLAGGALLADDMGLGKTLQTISLTRLRKSNSVLVACPGLARETWLDELRKWGVADDKIALVLPKGAKRRESNRQRILDNKASWVITSYDLLGEIPSLNYYTDFFIMDEAQSVKTAGKRNSANRAMKALEVGMLAPYRLALSGTPAEDRPKDWYGVLKVLFGKRFGSLYEFQLAYCDGHQGEHGFVADGISRAEELKKRTGIYTVRREKKDVAHELPECVMNAVWLEADEKATAAFRAWMLKLTRIDDALEACLEAKIPHAISRAHEAKRFLLFTHRVEHAERMAKRLNYEGTPCKLITGALQHSERQQAVRDAEANKCGIVATIDSAGMALNLQGVASYGIMHAMTWRPGQIMQARDRIYRLGQTERVQWDYLALRDSADEHVWNTVIAKLAMQQAAMESTKAIGATISALNTLPSLDTDDEALKAMYDGLPEGAINVDA